MSNPAYIWLVDENGSPIIGDSLVAGRIGSVELKSVNHNVNIPTDSNTGRLTGTRLHSPITLQKEFDKITPLLYRALCLGSILKSATIKMYRILDSGVESEYFNIILDNVKVVGITPNLYPGGQPEPTSKIFSYVMKPSPGNAVMAISYLKTHGITVL